MHAAFALLFALALPAVSLADDGYFSANIKNFSTRLPLLHVNTNGRVISKEAKASASVTIQADAENRSEELLRSAPTHFATIEVRGNSSSKWAKKQYDLEFHAAGNEDEEVKVSLLGLPAHHKWVLAAPYSDRAFIRNTFAFAMARSLGDKAGGEWWAPRTRAVELFINGKYQGVYNVTEKIGRGKERLDIAKTNWEDPYKSDFLVKVEKEKGRTPETHFETAYGTKINYTEPKAKDFAKQAKKNPRSVQLLKHHIQLSMHNFEVAVKAIKKGDFQSYRKLVDTHSVQNFILAHEIFRNIDGFRRSIYVHQKNGKLHLGPVWDFDLAWANLTAFTQMRAKGWQVGHSFYIDFNHELFWFRTMLKDPAFQRELARRYLTMRKAGGPLSTGVLFRKIDAMAGEFKNGPWQRNFTVWNVNGLSTDGIVMKFTPRFRDFSYPQHIAEMKAWLLERLEWMDDKIYEIGGEEAAESTADGLVLRPDLN